MASGKDVDKIERLRERLLQCTICMDEYKDPRILPCHHSICMECLVQYVRLSTATGYFFRCPQCRADITVPSGGLKEFPPNFFLSSLMDEIGTKTYSSSCEICERTWLQAQYRCIDCDKDICRFCLPDHKLFTHEACRTPGIIRIETANVSEMFTPITACAVHDEPPNVYCEQCEEIICLSCVCEDHKSHKTTSLVQKLQYVENDLSDESQSLKKELDNIQGDQEHLEKFAEKVCRRYAGIRNEIDLQAQHLHKVIEERSAKEMKKVDDVEDQFLKQVEAHRTGLEEYQKKVSNASDFLSDVQPEDISLELFSAFTKYKSEISESRKSFSKKIKYSEMSFFKGSWTIFFGFLVIAFGFTRKNIFQNTYNFIQNSEQSERKFGSIWVMLKNFVQVVIGLKKWIPRVPIPKWLTSLLAFLYVGMVTVLMVISLVYLAMQFFTLESEDCFSEDIVAGFSFCCFLFTVFGATVHRTYWPSLKAAFDSSKPEIP